VPWDRLYSLQPPYRPPVEHELDTQNFEQYEDDNPPASLAAGGGSRSRPIADPHFIGYTYKNWDAVHATQGGWAGPVVFVMRVDGCVGGRGSAACVFAGHRGFASAVPVCLLAGVDRGGDLVGRGFLGAGAGVNGGVDVGSKFAECCKGRAPCGAGLIGCNVLQHASAK
jgi:hypothetical protein